MPEIDALTPDAEAILLEVEPFTMNFDDYPIIIRQVLINVDVKHIIYDAFHRLIIDATKVLKSFLIFVKKKIKILPL